MRILYICIHISREQCIFQNTGLVERGVVNGKRRRDTVSLASILIDFLKERVLCNQYSNMFHIIRDSGATRGMDSGSGPPPHRP